MTAIMTQPSILSINRLGRIGWHIRGLKGHESIAQALAALAWVFISNGTALKGRQRVVLHDAAGFQAPPTDCPLGGSKLVRSYRCSLYSRLDALKGPENIAQALAWVIPKMRPAL
jgi:hypothetical protein